jgi:hypothetical protein
MRPAVGSPGFHFKSYHDHNAATVETCSMHKSKATVQNSSSGRSPTIRSRRDGSLSSRGRACAATPPFTSIGHDLASVSSSTHGSSLFPFKEVAVKSKPRKYKHGLNPVYPGDRSGDVLSHASTTLLSQLSSDSSSTVSRRMSGNNSFSSTVSDMLSADVEDVWWTKAVLDGIAVSQNVSVNSVIESVCDKLDDMDSKLFHVDGKEKPPRRWFPGMKVVLVW